MSLTPGSDVPPSRDPAGLSVVDHAVAGRQAHRRDEAGEGHRRAQQQQRNVVLDRVGVVGRVDDDLGHGPGHFVQVEQLLGLPAQVDDEVERADAGRRGGVSAAADLWGQAAPRFRSPVDAVGGGHDPLVADEGAAAAVAVEPVQADLPGPRPRRGVLPPDDPGVERGDAADWRETVRGDGAAAEQVLLLLRLNGEVMKW